jgi:hypothetical protein
MPVSRCNRSSEDAFAHASILFPKRSVLVLPCRPLHGRFEDGHRDGERRLLVPEDRREGKAFGGGLRSAAEGDDLVPVAAELVAEDDEQIAGLRGLNGIGASRTPSR